MKKKQNEKKKMSVVVIFVYMNEENMISPKTETDQQRRVEQIRVRREKCFILNARNSIKYESNYPLSSRY